jgi:hypothetical protein
MALDVEVEAGPESGGDLQGWVVTVRDEEYPGLVISFEYAFQRYDRVLLRSGFAVRWDPDVLAHSEITLYEIRRDFPVAVWERAAQSHVVRDIERLDEEYGRDEPTMERPSSGEDGASRLLLVAAEYVKNINEGVPDPVAAIARSHGVKPETARSWVHRARTKGHLGPAEAGKAGVGVGRPSSPRERRT